MYGPGVMTTYKYYWRNGLSEIEYSLLAWTCLRGSNADEDSLKMPANACVSERNTATASIDRRFTAKDSRAKLHRLYPFQS